MTISEIYLIVDLSDCSYANQLPFEVEDLEVYKVKTIVQEGFGPYEED
jgi:hypothetical protein